MEKHTTVKPGTKLRITISNENGNVISEMLTPIAVVSGVDFETNPKGEIKTVHLGHVKDKLILINEVIKLIDMDEKLIQTKGGKN